MNAINIAEHSENAASRPQWLTQAWLEPRLVVVTALAIVASFAAERLGAPDALVLLFNVVSYAAGGIFGAKTAIESLIQERKLDVDMLMVLAALGAASIGQWHEGALLLFLFSLSNVLQDYAIGRSRSAIKSLFNLYPEEAKVRREGEVVTVKLDQIRKKDVILIEPGERIPVDGRVLSGRSAIDESPITGESMPVDKGEGDEVFAGTLNKQGILDIEATRAASDTTLARIITMVEEAQDTQAPTERFLDKFEQYYAMFIIAAVGLFIVIPPALGLVDFDSNFYRAMVLMTVASPCALVISVPAAFISAIASAARGGVLFKGGMYLEALAGVKAIAFDKTGTLTIGEPRVTELVSCCEMSGNEMLAVAAAVESRSEHPLARAIVNEAKSRGLSVDEVRDFEALPGKGIVATVGGADVRLGSLQYLSQIRPLPESLLEARERLEADGQTVIGVVRENNCAGCDVQCDAPQRDCDWMGLIAMADQLRPESAQVVKGLRAQGIEVAMLTGDNVRVAQAIAEEVGITEVHAGLLPEDKVTALKQLQAKYGEVAMIGDGVNDAPALATADVGIAMGAAGTDVAMETADIVLMGDRIERIEYVIDLAKKARRVVWQNIIFSLAVIAMLVTGAFLIDLPLPLGVLGHEGSTVIVVLNGLISLLLIPEIQRRRANNKANAAPAT